MAAPAPATSLRRTLMAELRARRLPFCEAMFEAWREFPQAREEGADE